MGFDLTGTCHERNAAWKSCGPQFAVDFLWRKNFLFIFFGCGECFYIVYFSIYFRVKSLDWSGKNLEVLTFGNPEENTSLGQCKETVTF